MKFIKNLLICPRFYQEFRMKQLNLRRVRVGATLFLTLQPSYCNHGSRVTPPLLFGSTVGCFAPPPLPCVLIFRCIMHAIANGCRLQHSLFCIVCRQGGNDEHRHASLPSPHNTLHKYHLDCCSKIPNTMWSMRAGPFTYSIHYLV
jgi:hypothetical protein